MQDWFKQERNQLAAAVWGAGVFYFYKKVTSPNGLFELPHTADGWMMIFVIVAAGPVGWAITKRARWAKRVVFATICVVCLLNLQPVITSPTLFLILMWASAIYGLYSLARWDITRDTQFDERFHERLSDLLEKWQPAPLAESSVSLEFNESPSITCESLAAAVSKAFERECKVSDSTNSIDLGVEAAMTDDNTAVVGGVQTDIVGSWMIGARPVSLQVVCVAHDEGAVLRIETPRQFDREATNLDGYDWTIPLAVALWSPKTVCAKVGDEELCFTSSTDLLIWRKKS